MVAVIDLFLSGVYTITTRERIFLGCCLAVIELQLVTIICAGDRENVGV